MLTWLLNRTVPPCADAVAGSRAPTAASATSAANRVFILKWQSLLKTRTGPD